MSIFKKVLLALFVLPPVSFAATSFTLHCDMRSADKQSPLNLSMKSMVITQLGTPQDNLGISFSTLSIIKNDYSVKPTQKSIFFDDRLSHLIVEASAGKFSVVDGKEFPIKDPDDILNPKPVAVKLRNLKISTEFKASEDNDYPEFEKFSIDVKQFRADETRFLGKSAIVYDGEEYTDLITSCYFYIDWGTFKRSLKKKASQSKLKNKRKLKPDEAESSKGQPDWLLFDE